jgi:hypothetical protein
MFDVSLIKDMNSKNVSVNPDTTKVRIDELWRATTKQQKQKAVDIGGYTDTRSFNKTRMSGFISVRMAVSLALAVNIDPFYLTAESDVKSACNDDIITVFLRNHDFGHMVEDNIERPTKTEAISFITKMLDGLNEDRKKTIHSLTVEELHTLLDSILIRKKINDSEDIKLFLIKVLLTVN